MDRVTNWKNISLLLGVGTSLSSLWNIYTNSQLAKAIILVQQHVSKMEEEKKTKETEAEKQKQENVEQQEKINKILLSHIEKISQVEARAVSLEKKVISISALKRKMTLLEKNLNGTSETYTHQIGNVSEQISTIENVYRHNIEDLQDKHKTNSHRLETLEKQLHSLEQKQSMFHLFQGRQGAGLPNETSTANASNNASNDSSEESESESDSD
jgi:hypothetical protein